MALPEETQRQLLLMVAVVLFINRRNRLLNEYSPHIPSVVAVLLEAAGTEVRTKLVLVLSHDYNQVQEHSIFYFREGKSSALNAKEEA